MPLPPARVLFFLVLCLIVCHSAQAAAAQERPNILFIFTDDYAYDCVAALGNDQIRTPTIDSLVHNGTTFTRAYNMGSYSGAVCIASRMMLNSGRFVWASQALHNRGERERAAGRWWSEHMKAAGYETYMTGKWHVKASAKNAFDHMVHERPGMPNQTKDGYNRPHADGTDTWDPADSKFGGVLEGRQALESEVVADDADDIS